ncbi:translation initiation factor IF-3 [Patescibacteria group bacterium]|nr:translation initiation factor IF-3 [Patescibacteria group bacterium]
MKKYYNLNNRIHAPKLRVIDDGGKNLGVLKTSEALILAQEKELDLVEITDKIDPPVAKIMDFGQFLYEHKKSQQKAKIKAKKSETKGIRLSLRISKHDKDIRINQTKKFLDQGNKVKIEMKLMGRERQHFDLAKEIVNEFVDNLGENAIIEQPLIKQGGRLSVMVRKK